jgi:hypothetical protein
MTFRAMIDHSSHHHVVRKRFNNTYSCWRNSKPGGRALGSKTRSPLKDIFSEHFVIQASEKIQRRFTGPNSEQVTGIPIFVPPDSHLCGMSTNIFIRNYFQSSGVRSDSRPTKLKNNMKRGERGRTGLYETLGKLKH